MPPINSNPMATSASNPITDTTGSAPELSSLAVATAPASELKIDECIRLICSVECDDQRRSRRKSEFSSHCGGLPQVLVARLLQPKIEEQERQRENDQE